MELCIGAGGLVAKQHVDPATEAALVERCRRRDMDAFGRLVDLYQNRVHGFVRRMVPNSEEAADLTQDVFVRAFQHFGRFDARSSIRTWLFRIAYNLCVDRARRQDRMAASLGTPVYEGDEAFEAPDVRWDPERIVIDDELRGAIETAIGTMSDKLRTVLLLHDREDAPYEEIAKIVGVPIGTVKSRLFLARAHLQRAVTEYLQEEVGIDER